MKPTGEMDTQDLRHTLRVEGMAWAVAYEIATEALSRLERTEAKLHSTRTSHTIELANVRKELLKLMRGCTTYPFAQICRHMVGCDLVSAYERIFGSGGLSGLAAAFVGADDEKALNEVNNLLNADKPYSDIEW